MSEYPLLHLVIKPTLSCTANCRYCSYRKELHRRLVTERQLSIEEWKKVFSGAYRLGVKRLTISGGEPTLYKELVELVREGHSYGWCIHINSNGSLIDNKLARELVEAGLNTINISLYSPDPAIHDLMRRSKGLCVKAMSAIKIFSCLMRQYPHFTVNAQSIICRENYEGFAELLELHYALGARGAVISYLEGDFEKQYLLNKDEIEFFRKTIIPKAGKLLKNRGIAISQQLDRIFSGDIASITDWEKGVYWSRDRECNVAGNFALILANGDVHPCNIVEYTHQPILGNLFDHSLPEIWQSQETENFRKNKHEKCDLCPINIHLYINFYPLRGFRLIARKIAMKILGKYGYALIRSIYRSYKKGPFQHIRRKGLSL